MASLRLFILACFAGIITIERTIEAGYCSRSYACSAQGYRSTRYTTRCGMYGWKRCSRYRAVGYSYYKTCYTYYCCPGYTGATCSQPICSGSTSCPNGGTCIRPNQCSCRPGFSGSHCTDSNECQLGTHNCDQLCANTIGTFRCSCKPGYILQSNKRTCTDNNECLNNNGGCSQYCRNLDGSYECYCKDGLYLDIDEKSCIDTDECSSNNGDCEHLCMNEHATYRCECYQGYQLEPDGKSCIDLDECQSSSACAQLCQNKNGSYTCSCRPRYYLGSDGKSCNDINDCIGIHCSNGGNCIDMTESYSCKCQPGFEGTHCEKDIDECLHMNGGCEDQCFNTNGSYYCHCSNNGVLESDGSSCKDIDECLHMNGGCEDQCFNTNGSYYCQCRDNGVLESDGSSCKGQYLTSRTTSDQSGLSTSGIVWLTIGLLSIIFAVSFVVYWCFRLKKRKPVRNNDYTEFNTCNPRPVVTDQYDILNTTNMGTNDDNENQTDRNIHTYEECQPSNNSDRTYQNQNIQLKGATKKKEYIYENMKI